MHRRQEAVHAVVLAGEAELDQAAHDLLLQLLLAGHLGLQEQVAVLLQQRRQLVAAEAAAVEHGQRVAALVGEVLDEDEGEQRQALRGLVDLRAHLLGNEVVEAAAVAHQLEAEAAEQRAVGVLLVGQLGVELGVALADVVALEQLAEDRRQLGEFFEVDVHAVTRIVSPLPLGEGLGVRG
ncbi:hypothetical protein D9M68_676950 [compost metagenome]